MTGDPTKLTVVGATDLERRLLDAAAGEQPPAELSARMRLGLGLAPFAPPPPAAPSTASSAAAPVAAAKTGAAGWVAAGLVAAAVTGGVVLSRFQTPVPAPRTAALAIAAPVAPADEAAPVVHAAPHAERAGRVHHRAAAPTPAGPGMRGEIALVDAARTAVKSGDPERALALLHRYDTTFPAGAFRPEVAALCIEAFAADGQTDLARARARDFIAAHPESPLSARLARIAGVR